MSDCIINPETGKKQTDITGQRFGRLTVIRWIKEKKWLCDCDCGIKKIILKDHLLSGHTQSCGCLQGEVASKMHYIHGLCMARIQTIWKGMQQRCYNKNNPIYKFYGARGIKVCDRWLDFLNFWEDMWESYLEHCDKFGEKETTIERINVNGNYEKSNCRFATHKEQKNNTRRNHLITINGVTKTMMQWTEQYKINYKVVADRINKLNWEPLKALTTLIKK